MTHDIDTGCWLLNSPISSSMDDQESRIFSDEVKNGFHFSLSGGF